MATKKHKKTCAFCNQVYYAKNIRGTYCSDNCRVKANRKISVNVTGKPVEKLPEEIELEKILIMICQKENELKSFNEMEEHFLKKEQLKNQLINKKNDLIRRRDILVRENHKYVGGGTVSMKIAPQMKDPIDKAIVFWGGIIVDKLLVDPMQFKNNDQEIKKIDDEIKKINQSPDIKNSLLMSEGYIKKIKDGYNSELKELNEKKQQLEEIIDKKKNTKELSQLLDKDGFVSARDITHIKFADRISLKGDIGEFLGPIERNRCAISLSGVPGSGKTFFSFDLMWAFLDLKYSAAYFSMEEGISDLTREKIILYELQKEENCKFREHATLEDIHKFANEFDLIVIDSWGKLNVDIDEFDKLRVKFPGTFFIVIFQLTSAKTMRGGPKAAYDASVNISTYIEDGVRFAENTKNRYNKVLLKYMIDNRSLFSEGVKS